ncbi:MAG: hypothetical protein QOG87_3386 [Actinomycetota bacterium]|jgi:hypothetical protein
MTETAALEAWTRSLGCSVSQGERPGDLSAMPPGGGPPILIQRRNYEEWELIHERRIDVAAARAAWLSPADERRPTDVIDGIVRRLAAGYPLVEGQVMLVVGDELRLRFSARVYGEGLTQQAYLLTLSSVLKAVQAYDLAAAARADDLAALAEFQAEADAVVKQAADAADAAAATAPPPAPEANAPASAP